MTTWERCRKNLKDFSNHCHFHAPSIPEVLPKRCWVIGQKGINQAEELHHSLVLPQVFMALQEENKLMPVAACREWEEQLVEIKGS